MPSRPRRAGVCSCSWRRSRSARSPPRRPSGPTSAGTWSAMSSALQGDIVDLAALNLNDSVVTRVKPAGEFRVLGLGDSFAYGIVQYPYTYHRRAAEVLEATIPGRHVRMVDLGEPAVSFVQYGNALRRWERTLEHDGVDLMVYLGQRRARRRLQVRPRRRGLAYRLRTPCGSPNSPRQESRCRRSLDAGIRLPGTAGPRYELARVAVLRSQGCELEVQELRRLRPKTATGRRGEARGMAVAAFISRTVGILGGPHRPTVSDRLGFGAVGDDGSRNDRDPPGEASP